MNGQPLKANPAITTYDMGLVVSRLAEILGCGRSDVKVIHYPPNPWALEMWRVGPDGMAHSHLGTLQVWPKAEDPYSRERIRDSLIEGVLS